MSPYVLVTWLLLAAGKVAAQPAAPLVTWYKPELYESPRDALMSMFSRELQPLSVAKTVSRADGVNRTKVFFLGGGNLNGGCANPSMITGVEAALWRSLMLMDAGNTAVKHSMPSGAVRLQGSTAVVHAPGMATQDALCTAGGYILSIEMWRPTARVLCSFDAVMFNVGWRDDPVWADQMPLPGPLLGATFLQTHFGTWLIGGRRTDVPGWSGILAADWARDGRSIVGWRVVAPLTPLGPRLYPAALWSWEYQTMFLGGGQVINDEGAVITGVETDGVELQQWSVSPADVSNRTAWRVVGTLPAGRTVCKGLEPEHLFSEGVTSVPNRALLPYPEGGYNATQEKALASSNGWAMPSFPVVVYITAGVFFINVMPGANWMNPDPYVNPSVDGAEGVVLARSLVVMGSRASSFYPRGTFMIGGVGSPASTHKRKDYYYAWTTAYPFRPCANPCGALFIPTNPTSFSTGCMGQPTDAICELCTSVSAPQCSAGQVAARECGRSFYVSGHPKPEVCKACSTCSEGFYVAQACNRVNDTVCEMRIERPQPDNGPAVPPLPLTPMSASWSLFGLTLLNLFIGCLAILLRLLGNRNFRAWAGSRCGLPTSPPKPWQDWAVYAASVSLSLLMLVYNIAVGVILLTGELALQSGQREARVTDLGLSLVLLTVAPFVGTAVVRNCCKAPSAVPIGSPLLHIAAFVHPRNLLFYVVASTRAGPVPRVTKDNRDGAGAQGVQEDDGGAQSAKITQSDLSSSLGTITAWTASSAALFDLSGLVLWFWLEVVSQSATYGRGQDETGSTHTAYACMAGTLHALVSLLLSSYAISSARYRMLRQKVVGERHEVVIDAVVANPAAKGSLDGTVTQTSGLRAGAEDKSASGTRQAAEDRHTRALPRAAVVSALLAQADPDVPTAGHTGGQGHRAGPGSSTRHAATTVGPAVSAHVLNGRGTNSSSPVMSVEHGGDSTVPGATHSSLQESSEAQDGILAVSRVGRSSGHHDNGTARLQARARDGRSSRARRGHVTTDMLQDSDNGSAGPRGGGLVPPGRASMEDIAVTPSVPCESRSGTSQSGDSIKSGSVSGTYVDPEHVALLASIVQAELAAVYAREPHLRDVDAGGPAV